MLKKYQKPSSHDDYDPLITAGFIFGTFLHTIPPAVVVFLVLLFFWGFTVAIIATIALFAIVLGIAIWWWYH